MLVAFGLGVAREDELAAIGSREVHVEELHGREFLEHDPRREAWRTLLDHRLERDVQAIGHKRDEDMRFDARLVLMEEGSNRQIALQVFERRLELGQLQIELP